MIPSCIQQNNHGSEQIRGHERPCCGETDSKRTTQLQHNFAWGTTVGRVQQGTKWEGRSGSGTVFAKADQAGHSREAEFGREQKEGRKRSRQRGQQGQARRGQSSKTGHVTMTERRRPAARRGSQEPVSQRPRRARGGHSRCKEKPKRVLTR